MTLKRSEVFRAKIEAIRKGESVFAAIQKLVAKKAQKPPKKKV